MFSHPVSSQSVIVRSSPINGLGVFALAEFQQGETVLTIDDSYVVDEQHPIPPGEENHCDFLDGGRAVWMQSPERHINHSCRPNVYVHTKNGVRHVVALRKVSPGEEIAYDYCVNGYGDVVWTCSCGSVECRKTIHSDFFHLPISIQFEYLPLLDEWFRQERVEEIERLRSWANAPGIRARP